MEHLVALQAGSLLSTSILVIVAGKPDAPLDILKTGVSQEMFVVNQSIYDGPRADSLDLGVRRDFVQGNLSRVPWAALEMGNFDLNSEHR